MPSRRDLLKGIAVGAAALGVSSAEAAQQSLNSAVPPYPEELKQKLEKLNTLYTQFQKADDAEKSQMYPEIKTLMDQTQELTKKWQAETLERQQKSQ